MIPRLLAIHNGSTYSLFIISTICNYDLFTIGNQLKTGLHVLFHFRWVLFIRKCIRIKRGEITRLMSGNYYRQCSSKRLLNEFNINAVFVHLIVCVIFANKIRVFFSIYLSQLCLPIITFVLLPKIHFNSMQSTFTITIFFVHKTASMLMICFCT